MRSGSGTVSALAVVGAAACLPGSGPALNPYVDDAGTPSPSLQFGSDGAVLGDVDLGDPFAVVGLSPSHGPWAGGTHTVVSGRGFASSVRVWVGSAEVDPSNVLASDPTHISVVTPPGAPGAADVRVQNVTGEERVLRAGFQYDSFSVSPTQGATTGGTRIALLGSGTRWTSASVVAVGGHACLGVTVTDATDLTCTTPPGSPGSNDVTVTNADKTVDQARDAFTYADSPDGYRGGLYGSALSGGMTVLAFDQLTGSPLTGGKAIAGSTIETSLLGTFDSSGVVRLTDPSLHGKVTVTVAAKCHQPVTFVDVAVDTVTAYLQPELDPSCQGDPPSSGNYYGVQPGVVEGELVWKGIEFSRGSWSNVPAAKANERQVAYVWTTTDNPADAFQLPSASEAVTPMTDGTSGYAYTIGALPGNRNVYALAGIEDRSVVPPRFEAYALGITRGVLAQPGVVTAGVQIPMTTVLDHVLATLPQPPAPSPPGPDRIVSKLDIDVGSGQYVILPRGTMTTFLPVAGDVSFVGVPGLAGSLAGASYEITGAAVTGPSLGTPLSVVTGVETTDANDPLTLGGFFGIPRLLQPSAAVWSGRHVTIEASVAPDLAIVDVSSGGGLVDWQIIAPGSSLDFDVPDLSRLPDVGATIHGPIVTTFSIVRIRSFDYTRLRYGQLSSASWSAYAQDTAAGSY
jgi:IPT/TIG domain